MGPELEKTEKEIANYRKFARLYQEAIEVNEKICLLRPVPEMDEGNELEELKKKLKRKFFKKPGKKSIS